MVWMQSIASATEMVVLRLFVPAPRTASRLPSLQLAGIGGVAIGGINNGAIVDALQEALWFAVPKKKVTKSKKRMKTTKQFRIKLRQDIVADPRTGEATLSHKLPFNWRETYIPKYD